MLKATGHYMLQNASYVEAPQLPDVIHIRIFTLHEV